MCVGGVGWGACQCGVCVMYVYVRRLVCGGACQCGVCMVYECRPIRVCVRVCKRSVRDGG